LLIAQSIYFYPSLGSSPLAICSELRGKPLPTLPKGGRVGRGMIEWAREMTLLYVSLYGIEIREDRVSSKREGLGNGPPLRIII
jgi:hypothetical protein